MADLGKLLVGVGLAVALLGALLLLAGRAGLPIGRLPGDIVYRGRNTTVYFPLVTSVVLSVVLSLALYLLGRLRR